MILIDEAFHEKHVDFKFIPDEGSILEIALTKSTKARYTVVGHSMQGTIPCLHLKWIGRS